MTSSQHSSRSGAVDKIPKLLGTTLRLGTALRLSSSRPCALPVPVNPVALPDAGFAHNNLLHSTPKERSSTTAARTAPVSQKTRRYWPYPWNTPRGFS